MFFHGALQFFVHSLFHFIQFYGTFLLNGFQAVIHRIPGGFQPGLHPVLKPVLKFQLFLPVVPVFLLQRLPQTGNIFFKRGGKAGELFITAVSVILQAVIQLFCGILFGLSHRVPELLQKFHEIRKRFPHLIALHHKVPGAFFPVGRKGILQFLPVPAELCLYRFGDFLRFLCRRIGFILFSGFPQKQHIPCQQHQLQSQNHPQNHFSPAFSAVKR